jgi:hypothetical protein
LDSIGLSHGGLFHVVCGGIVLGQNRRSQDGDEGQEPKDACFQGSSSEEMTMCKAGSFYQEAGKLYIWRECNNFSVATGLFGLHATLLNLSEAVPRTTIHPHVKIPEFSGKVL